MSGWRVLGRLLGMAAMMLGALLLAILAPVYVFGTLYALFSP